MIVVHVYYVLCFEFIFWWNEKKYPIFLSTVETEETIIFSFQSYFPANGYKSRFTERIRIQILYSLAYFWSLLYLQVELIFKFNDFMRVCY